MKIYFLKLLIFRYFPAAADVFLFWWIWYSEIIRYTDRTLVIELSLICVFKISLHYNFTAHDAKVRSEVKTNEQKDTN